MTTRGARLHNPSDNYNLRIGKIYSFDRSRIHAAIDGLLASLPPRDARLARLERLYHDLESLQRLLPHVESEREWILSHVDQTQTERHGFKNMSTDKKTSTPDIRASIPGYKAYDAPQKVQLDREIFQVDKHGKQTLRGFMLGVARMSPSKANEVQGREQKDWAAVVLQLTSPVLDPSTKKPFPNMGTGFEIFVGGVKLQELYQRATNPRLSFEVELTPTEKKAMGGGKSTWLFDANVVGEAPRAHFGPPILPIKVSGMGDLDAVANGHAQLPPGKADSDLDEIMG